MQTGHNVAPITVSMALLSSTVSVGMSSVPALKLSGSSELEAGIRALVKEMLVRTEDGISSFHGTLASAVADASTIALLDTVGIPSAHFGRMTSPHHRGTIGHRMALRLTQREVEFGSGPDPGAPYMTSPCMKSPARPRDGMNRLCPGLTYAHHHMGQWQGHQLAHSLWITVPIRSC